MLVVRTPKVSERPILLDRICYWPSKGKKTFKPNQKNKYIFSNSDDLCCKRKVQDIWMYFLGEPNLDLRVGKAKF